MRNLIILTAAVAAVAVPATAQAQRVPAAVVVVVDTDKVYSDCNACRTAKTQLQAQAQAFKNRQQTLSNQLRPEAEAIQKAVQALNGKEPDAALQKRAQDFQDKEQQANQELQNMQQNLQSINANVIRQIDAKYNPAVSQVMTQRGANLAVDVGATIAHVPALDVTDAVIAAVNATLPAVSLTPLPQAQQQQQPQGR